MNTIVRIVALENEPPTQRSNYRHKYKEWIDAMEAMALWDCLRWEHGGNYESMRHSSTYHRGRSIKQYRIFQHEQYIVVVRVK